MKSLQLLCMLVLLAPATGAHAQGPPITLDKPIMLGAKKGTARAYLKTADNAVHDYAALLLEADYNFSNRIAVGIEVPVVLPAMEQRLGLGDLGANLKYQFFRKDGMGKTLRIAAKAKGSAPTGRSLATPVLGMGHAMAYGGILAAYESLRLGVQSEAGYTYTFGHTAMNQLQYKLGTGIPLLKPRYPVNQVTVYLELEGANLPQGRYGYYGAPGLQYARGRATFDLSVQFPFIQDMPLTLERRWAGLVGGRIIL